MSRGKDFCVKSASNPAKQLLTAEEPGFIFKKLGLSMDEEGNITEATPPEDEFFDPACDAKHNDMTIAQTEFEQTIDTGRVALALSRHDQDTDLPNLQHKIT